MPSPGGQFLSDEFGDIEDYFVSDSQLIDQYIGDQLWVWGRGPSGQLGNFAITNRTTPVTTFAGGTNWKQVSSGGFHAAAIKTDGTLWVWGNNSYGQLGINDIAVRSTPVTTFAGGTNWKQVNCGDRHTAAIKTDGTLWTWGFGRDGQLGNNSTINRSIPVTTFLGGTNWKQVSVGGIDIAISSIFEHNTAAIKTDGTLWIWGKGVNGKLGTNDTIDRSTPVTTFAGGTNWKQVDLGHYHASAIKTDGTLWVWGRNGIGSQLGINSIIDKSTPVTTFLGGTNWKQVSSGVAFSAAIKTNGNLWTWGNNSFVRLGVNDTATRSTPVTTILGGTNWKSVDCVGVNTVAIKTDGTLWIWGDNAYGQLGINDITARSTPVTTFAGGTNWKSVGFGKGFFISAIPSGLNVDLR